MSDQDRVNLTQDGATAKIRHIADGQIAILSTYVGSIVVSRPMATLGIDPDGALWFMCRQDSHEAQQIRTSGRAHLTYSVHERSEYMALEGSATVLRDQAKIDELWTPIAKTWFPDGKDDPRIALIRFNTKAGHYWDTKAGKMLQFLGMLVGAVTGKETDGSVEGSLRPS